MASVLVSLSRPAFSALLLALLPFPGLLIPSHTPFCLSYRVPSQFPAPSIQPTTRPPCTTNHRFLILIYLKLRYISRATAGLPQNEREDGVRSAVPAAKLRDGQPVLCFYVLFWFVVSQQRNARLVSGAASVSSSLASTPSNHLLTYCCCSQYLLPETPLHVQLCKLAVRYLTISSSLLGGL